MSDIATPHFAGVSLGNKGGPERTHIPSGGACATCMYKYLNCSGLDFESMKVIAVVSESPLKIVKCSERIPQDRMELPPEVKVETPQPSQLISLLNSPLTEEELEFGLNCNLEDPSDEEAAAFFVGARFAEQLLRNKPRYNSSN